MNLFRVYIAVSWMVFLLFGIEILGRIHGAPKPPKATRILGSIELFFGLFVYMFAISGISGPMWSVLLSIIGLIWIVTALYLYKGNRISRNLFLVLGTIRIFTVVGAIFSFISFYLFLFTESSRKYFSNRGEE